MDLNNDRYDNVDEDENYYDPIENEKAASESGPMRVAAYHVCAQLAKQQHLASEQILEEEEKSEKCEIEEEGAPYALGERTGGGRLWEAGSCQVRFLNSNSKLNCSYKWYSGKTFCWLIQNRKFPRSNDVSIQWDSEPALDRVFCVSVSFRDPDYVSPFSSGTQKLIDLPVLVFLFSLSLFQFCLSENVSMLLTVELIDCFYFSDLVIAQAQYLFW